MWGQLIGPTGVLDLVLPRSRIGRLAKKADVVINKPYISGVHCTIELCEDNSVQLTDLSTNGVYVNGNVVGRSVPMRIVEDDEISFTKPGVKSPGVEPTFFRFHFVNGNEPQTPSHRLNKRPRSPFTTPDQTVINSAKKLCVSSTTQRDELISGTEAMQRANQELRQRIVDLGNQENELKEKVQSMLVVINDKQTEHEKTNDELMKLRAHTMQQDHKVEELTANTELFKQQEEEWKAKEAEWIKQKESHTATSAELAALQRQAENTQNIVKLLEQQLEENSTKLNQATQQVRDLEVENHKLKMQLDTFQMKHDRVQEDTRRGTQEEMLVMKARFATAREAFLQMEHFMSLLGEQIQIPAAKTYSAKRELLARDFEEDEDDETQCMDRSKVVSTLEYTDESDSGKVEYLDEETKPITPPPSNQDFDNSSDDEQEAKQSSSDSVISPEQVQLIDTTTNSPETTDVVKPLIIETKKRWLQLNSNDDSHNDSGTGLFDETQISQDLQDE
ncbi:hypothetical protein THRCLA_02435 [Thraustotheca clavata]|uniref:FHA domain-containing protein n=1 Tax=Thraustotheca clavata TaxID=74557 RepID=A0A1W0A583_9STRA|nr:hypothetical protein THRCLA_02435 [Thraustotheca clavata]